MIECDVNCPYCGIRVRTTRQSGNEERVARCYFPCRELFAIRWIEGAPFTAQIAWPMSTLARQAETGKRWEADSSLEEWFPITARKMAVLDWLESGRFRQVTHTHFGAFRLRNLALNISCEGGSIETITGSPHWPEFRDCTERAP